MSVRVHRVSVAVAALLAHAAVAAEETPPRVRVIEGRVAVFATTNAVREAVVWLPAGAELTVRGELSDGDVWVCVEPPGSVGVWVYRELVRDGVVLADKSRVRTGAGLNFRPVGSLSKGDRVEVRGTYGDWLRISPPRGLAFWVLRDQVEPLAVMPPDGVAAEAEDVPVGGPEVLATNVTSVAVATVATNLTAVTRPVAVQAPPQLAGLALSAAPDQGMRVLLTGLLDWGTVGAVAAPFCLVVRQPDGDTRPFCHVLAPAAVASPYIGATVTVEGTRWLVKGSDLPVVLAETVSVVE